MAGRAADRRQRAMQDQPNDRLVTKSEFAALIGVTPGRISQYIRDGIVGSDALEGEGRSAKVRLAVATAQIKARRDVSQALGNGAATRVHMDRAPAADLLPPMADTPPAPAATDGPEKPQHDLPRTDPVADQIQKEKLAQARMATDKMRREEAAQNGRYMLSAEARAVATKAAAEIMTSVMAGLSDVANALAARFELPVRDVKHELQAAFRTVREEAAERHRENAAAIEALVSDEAAAEDDGEDA